MLFLAKKDVPLQRFFHGRNQCKNLEGNRYGFRILGKAKETIPYRQG